ncbi:sigma-70 family RNA polymerase sigma factor [Patescibacteria group bacterium]|nr:sigma-70 family RNA polymerase sigma factor [Patescibacteria group bacterium]
MSIEKTGPVVCEQLYKTEITNKAIPQADNRKLGARIFVGKLALRALTRIKQSPFTNPDQQMQIKNILEVNPAKFLLSVSNSGINQSRDSLVRNEYKKEYRRQKDRELMRITRKHSIWLKGKLSNDNQIQPLIDRQIELARAGELAWKRLSEGNLKLAVSRAKKQAKNTGLPYVDLQAWAEDGLMQAAARYDFRLGFKFSTYAVWCLKQLMKRGEMNESLLIRIPVHWQEEVIRGKRELDRSTQEGSEPDPVIKDQLSAYRNLTQPVSLNKPCIEDGDPLGDILEDTGTPTLEEQINHNELGEMIRKTMACLSEKEQLVLTLRFGLGDRRQRTLEEIGRELHVTRERIRQIEKKALRKLRHPTRSRELRPYLV